MTTTVPNRVGKFRLPRVGKIEMPLTRRGVRRGNAPQGNARRANHPADLREVYRAITALEVWPGVLAATRKPDESELAPLRKAAL